MSMVFRYEAQACILIDYTNWRGERSERYITPLYIEWGSNEWHPEPQWLMVAFCHIAKANRAFALKSIHRWGT